MISESVGKVPKMRLRAVGPRGRRLKCLEKARKARNAVNKKRFSHRVHPPSQSYGEASRDHKA